MDSARVRHWLKELLIMGAIAAAVFFTVRWFQLDQQRGGGGSLEVGSRAPAFSLTEARSGERVTLADLAGKPVILAFWATYCGPCRSELPDLEAVYRDAGERYAVVTVSREARGLLQRFADERKLTMPVLVDGGGTVHGAYGVSTIPMTVIIDREGHVVHDFTGAADPQILADHMDRLSDPGGG